MDYNSINNCMSDQQKLSLSAAALQEMVNGDLTYDDINNKMSDQQKLSLIAASLQELKDKSGVAPVYIEPSIQDFSEDGGGSTGEIFDIQGWMTSYESFTNAVIFGFSPDSYRPVRVAPLVELPNDNYLAGTVPAQFRTNGDGDVEVVFHIYSTAETKDRIYSLVLSQSEEEARGGGHAIDAVWTRLA